MLTDMMEGKLRMAPDAGAEQGQATPFIPDYGTAAGTSAPERVEAVAQAQEPVVDEAGTGAAEGQNAEEKKAETVQTPAWMAQLPKDMRNNPELAKYRTMGDAFKDLMAQATGKTEEARGSEEPEEAQPQEGKEVPIQYNNFAVRLSEGNDPMGVYTDGMIEGLQGLGIPQDKAEAIIGLMDKAQNTATERFVNEGKKLTETILQKQWGKDYQSKRALMAKGYMALGDGDGSLQKALDEQGASLSPAVWEVLSRVGNLVSEDRAVGSDKGRQAVAKDPDVPVTYTY